MRQELVPLALDAYPEAYAEFRRCMMAFVYGPDAPESPVSDLWSLKQRAAAAGQLARTVRQLRGAPRSPVDRRVLRDPVAGLLGCSCFRS